MFMKEARNDLGSDIDWTIRKFVDFHKSQSDYKTVENKIPKNAKDYALTYGLDGRPRLCNPASHNKPHNWRSPLAQFIRFAWGEWRKPGYLPTYYSITGRIGRMLII